MWEITKGMENTWWLQKKNSQLVNREVYSWSKDFGQFNQEIAYKTTRSKKAYLIGQQLFFFFLKQIGQQVEEL